jgi:hypothetical protein
MLLHLFGIGTLVTLVCSILLLGSSFYHSPLFSLEILVFDPRFFLFDVIFFHLFRLSLQLLFRRTLVLNLVKELLAVSKIDSGTTSSFEKLRNYQRFRKCKTNSSEPSSGTTVLPVSKIDVAVGYAPSFEPNVGSLDGEGTRGASESGGFVVQSKLLL